MWFRKRGNGRETGATSIPPTDMQAVPLTAADVEVLVVALTDIDRKTNPWGDFFTAAPSPNPNHAASVLRAAALAHALGHPTVPFPVDRIRRLEDVRRALQRWSPAAPCLAALEQLELKLHALSALASRNGWRYEVDHDARTVRWGDAVPDEDAAEFPQLPAGETGGGR